MSELVDPTVNLEFYEISSRGKKMPEDAAEFTVLKKYIARSWSIEVDSPTASFECCFTAASNSTNPYFQTGVRRIVLANCAAASLAATVV